MSHSCAQNRVEHLATREQPFHFLDSGLSDVYLIGIKYYTCECGSVVAEIPAIKQLMQLIARDLLEKPTSLIGEEIRFLRKRLGKKQVDFANEIGLEPETLNRYENDRLQISETSDKLIRFFYLIFSNDPNLDEARTALYELLKQWETSSHSQRIVKEITDNEWHDELVAA